MKTNSGRSLSTNASLLKQINYVRILGLLRCHAGLSRAEIARHIGLTRSTVTVVTAELISDGLIREGSEMASKPKGGRPGVELDLNPDGAFFIGAAIEVDHIKVVELDLAAKIKNKLSVPLTSTDPDTVISHLIKLINQVRQSNYLSDQRLRGVGLTIPGTINRDGVLIRVPGLKWHGVNLRQYLESHVNIPLFIDNDANAAALAEVYLSSAVQCENLLFLLLNAGVGSGIVMDHRIVRGANGTAGEVCDLIIDIQDSTSGEYQAGSFGALVGKEGLLQQYCEKVGKAVSLYDLIDALKQGDTIAHSIALQWVHRLGRGLINIVNILDPEQVVLGGSLTALLPFVEEQLNQILESNLLLHDGKSGLFNMPNSQWRISQFGEDASAIGGAVLVYQSLFQIPDLVLLGL